jgi:membrane protease YdiL (CAAX protease family)
MGNKALSQGKKENVLFLLLLTGLLLLRFPLLLLSSYHVITISKTMVKYIFEDGTYLLTALVIVLKRNSLADYNMGICALALFMIAPVAQLISQYLVVQYRGPVQADLWVRIAISLGLLILLLVCRPKVRKRSVKEILLWGLIAVAVGIGIGFLLGKLNGLQSAEKSPVHPSGLLIMTMFFTQLGNAAVMEEPLFRGFLWGFLEKLHWKGCWIWLTQAGLFWLGHIYYLGVANYSFWIIVPVGGLFLGALAWRSRSIGTSMVTHGLFNSIGDIVAHFTW